MYVRLNVCDCKRLRQEIGLTAPEKQPKELAVFLLRRVMFEFSIDVSDAYSFVISGKPFKDIDGTIRYGHPITEANVLAFLQLAATEIF